MYPIYLSTSSLNIDCSFNYFLFWFVILLDLPCSMGFCSLRILKWFYRLDWLGLIPKCSPTPGKRCLCMDRCGSVCLSVCKLHVGIAILLSRQDHEEEARPRRGFREESTANQHGGKDPISIPLTSG